MRAHSNKPGGGVKPPKYSIFGRYVFTIFIVLGLGVTRASKADDCGDILRFGIFDTAVADTEFTYESLTLRSVCSASDSTLSAAARITDAVNGSISSTTKKTACDKSREGISLRETDKSVLKTASTAIVNAWSKCMDNSSYGLKFSLEQLQNVGMPDVLAHVRFSAEQATAKLTGSFTIPTQLARCRCESQPVGKCTVDERRRAVTFELQNHGRAAIKCSRINPDPIRVSLASDRGDREATLASLWYPGLNLAGNPVPIRGTCKSSRDPKRNLRLATVSDQQFSLIANEVVGAELIATLEARTSEPTSNKNTRLDLFRGCAVGQSTCMHEVKNVWLHTNRNEKGDKGLFLKVVLPGGHILERTLVNAQTRAGCTTRVLIPSVKITVTRRDRWLSTSQ
jgi:hypothetical protein